LLAQGSTELRKRFEARFQEPNLHATLRRRLVMGNIVIDHETVSRTFLEGCGSLELIMIFDVQAGRIIQAWTILGAKTLADGEV